MSDLQELSNLDKYNGKEYNLWKFQAQAFLDGRGLLEIVDGTETMPSLPSQGSSSQTPDIQFGKTLFKEFTTPSPNSEISPAQIAATQHAILEFKKRDKQAFSILTQLVDKKIMHQIINCKTSKEIWDKLALIHQRTAIQSLYQLQENYYNMRLGENGDKATFIGNLEMLNSQIEELGSRPFSEDMLISKMLRNLPASYDTSQPMWKTVNPTQQTLINLQTWLLDEERSIRKRQAENAHSHTSAYYPKSFRPSGQSGSYRYNPKASGSASGSPPHTLLPPDQGEARLHRAQEIAAKKQVSHCGNCGEIGHWHKECPHSPRRHVPSRNPGMPVPPTHPSSQFLDCDIQPTDWFADSGSPHHMSDQRSWFTNFTAVPVGTWPVQSVAGHTTFVEGFGDIAIEIFIRNQWERGVLTDVLFVPTLHRNLFSVSSAALKNINTLYTNTGCQMLADGIVLMEGSLEGMLYKLHIKAIPSFTHANLSNL